MPYVVGCPHYPCKIMFLLPPKQAPATHCTVLLLTSKNIIITIDGSAIWMCPDYFTLFNDQQNGRGGPNSMVLFSMLS